MEQGTCVVDRSLAGELPRAPMDNAERMLPDVGTAHLIGIGGSGMRALAHVLHARGWRLTGSDGGLLAPKLLSGTRVRVAPGHCERYVPASADVAIFSPAVPAENCERQRAQRMGIPVVSYPQMVAHLTRDLSSVAIAGTHGKTTTAAMLAAILIRAQWDPTVMIGGAPQGWRSGGRHGQGQHLVVEACEYQGSFLHLVPQVAAVLGIEPDHFDYFRSSEHLESTFAEFVRRVPASGRVLVNSACARTREVCRDLSASVITCGTRGDDVWRLARLDLDAGFARMEVWRAGRRFIDVTLRTPGRHQAFNALAAIALAGELGVDSDLIRVGLEEFRGVHRRMEVIGQFDGVTVIDDYAHHPTAVGAALETVRGLFPGRRTVCLFEPHQSSRLAALLDDFAQNLHNASKRPAVDRGADKIWITNVFRAREGHVPQRASAQDLVSRLTALGSDCQWAGNVKHLLSGILADVGPGDILVTLGAGEVGKIRHAIVERLRRRGATR